MYSKSRQLETKLWISLLTTDWRNDLPGGEDFGGGLSYPGRCVAVSNVASRSLRHTPTGISLVRWKSPGDRRAASPHCRETFWNIFNRRPNISSFSSSKIFETKMAVMWCHYQDHQRSCPSGSLHTPHFPRFLHLTREFFQRNI